MIGSRMLPAATVARTLHIGPYQGLVAAYAAITDWIRDSDWHAAGPVQERYINGPGSTTPTDDYRTEVEIPIEPALVGAHL
jgi:effector-binding domain-containing protein